LNSNPIIQVNYSSHAWICTYFHAHAQNIAASGNKFSEGYCVGHFKTLRS